MKKRICLDLQQRRPSQGAAILLVAGLATTFTAFAAGCAGDAGEGKDVGTGALDAVEAEDAVVIEKEATDVAKVSPDKIELPKIAASTRGRLKVGSVVVGRRGRGNAGKENNPHGFLRKVTAISAVSGSGVVLTTSPATLGEAIKQGETAKKTGPLDPYSSSSSSDNDNDDDEGTTGVRPRADEDLAAGGGGGTTTPMRFSHTFEPKSLISTPNFEAKIEPTTTSCTPTFDTALRLRGFKLDTLRFVMNDRLTIQSEISATARGRFDQNVSVPLFRNKIALPPQQIGPIPVVETVDVSVDLACDFSAEGSVTARAGIRADFSYRFGIEYADGDWHMVADAGDISLAPVGPTVEAQASTRLDCRIIPRVALLFYDVVGPYLSVTPRIVATANGRGRYSPTEPPQRPTGEWAITGSLRAEAGLTGSITIPGAPSITSLINDGIRRSQLELFSYEKQWTGAL